MALTRLLDKLGCFRHKGRNDGGQLDMGFKRAAGAWAALRRAQRPLQEAQEALRAVVLDQSIWDGLGKQGCSELDAGVRAALATLYQALQRTGERMGASGEQVTSEGRESARESGDIRAAREVVRGLLEGVVAAQEVWAETFSRPVEEYFRRG